MIYCRAAKSSAFASVLFKTHKQAHIECGWLFCPCWHSEVACIWKRPHAQYHCASRETDGERDRLRETNKPSQEYSRQQNCLMQLWMYIFIDSPAEKLLLYVYIIYGVRGLCIFARLWSHLSTAKHNIYPWIMTHKFYRLIVIAFVLGIYMTIFRHEPVIIDYV